MAPVWAGVKNKQAGYPVPVIAVVFIHKTRRLVGGSIAVVFIRKI